ncbi:uncharacterized protein PV09_00180 [Verruconis gallopava]|uniref:MARVEL domain-containing protein n=1 Tax=Verruconis gallopava TaxID=253628 RepID=A0A0D2ARC3_9PEZI|nr:uncharacterized protein PV09_00180 [Verruconis gallopava]KIW09258.1 hypothetical protein PV09_00180 [Verruconis gallopava]
MRQALSTLQKVKTGVHTLQALLIFVAACITLAVFVQQGSTDGRTKWFFAVCWLSIPALIYLVAVPIWSRAANVAKAMWFAIVDVLFAIFWLAAFAAVLSWNRDGTIQGAKDKKIPTDQANCTTFAYGTEKKCSLSYSASSVGVVIFLLFLISSGISIFYTVKVKKNPQMDDPWLAPESAQPYKPAMNDAELGDPKDPVWDANTQDIDGPHDADSDDGRMDGRHYGTDTEDGRHPGQPVQWGGHGPFDDAHAVPPYEDTEYRGASSYQPPSALSPTNVYSPQNRDAPEYGSSRSRQTGGYSFSAPHTDA